MDQRDALGKEAGGLPGALILGGAHGSLAVARSLGRRGIPVWFVTSDHPIASYSRHVARSFHWRGPNHADALSALLEFAAKNGLQGWVLFAGGDAEVQFVARAHKALSTLFTLAMPAWETIRWAFDKRLIHEHAASVGVHSPWSLYPESAAQLDAAAGRFPLILKPTLRTQRNAFTNAKAWRADSAKELQRLYERAIALVGSKGVAIQELIAGGGEAQFSYAGLWDRGAPIASLVARRTRQFPLQFGYTSTFVETLEENEVEKAACRFLAALRYSGVVEIEFKYDARDGRYKLLDVNPRVWTWIALGAAAGVDFPFLHWQLALGQSPAPVRAAAGRSWMFAARDFLAALQLMAGGRLALSDYAKCWRRPAAFAAAAADDPLPGFLDTPLAAARVFRRCFSACLGREDSAAAPSIRGRRSGSAVIGAALASLTQLLPF